VITKNTSPLPKPNEPEKNKKNKRLEPETAFLRFRLSWHEKQIEKHLRCPFAPSAAEVL